jgi:hypothetical protein
VVERKRGATDVDEAVEEEEYAGGIAVLSGGGEEKHVVVLDEGVGDAGAVVDDGRVDLRVALISVKLRYKSQLRRSKSGGNTDRPPCRAAW